MLKTQTASPLHINIFFEKIKSFKFFEEKFYVAHLLFLNIFSIISSSDILELAEIIKFSQFVFLERNLLSFFNLFKRIVYGFLRRLEVNLLTV